MIENPSQDKRINSIEALLYSEGGEMSKIKLLSALNLEKPELSNLIKQYNTKSGGLNIVEDDKHLILRVSVAEAPIVEAFRGASAREDISKAGLEVLSIVLYKGPSTASDIEYIRGVNSGYTLRQLTSRGLLLRVKNGMTYRYSASADLLALIGINSVLELPKRDEVLESLAKFEEQNIHDREANK